MDITPGKQNVDTAFSNTDYYIDFYQREYKWEKEEVVTLLDDLFYKFNQDYKEGIDANAQTIERYSWYYLNTYITNKVDGRLYVVDGQQRLTTLSLILVKLHHLCADRGLNQENWLRKRIVDYGKEGETFWMGHGKRHALMRALFDSREPTQDEKAGLTAANMLANYRHLARYLDNRLDTDHRLQTFVFYFLLRVVLIELTVEQTDVPMVFEVINDRGVRLKPHEILKGKLLGQIDKQEVDELNEIWESQIGPLDAEDKADEFFGTYLKARFADTRAESHKFEDDYQRTIFEGSYNDVLGFKNKEQPTKATDAIKEFIRCELPYFVRLFNRVNQLAEEYDEDLPHVHFNSLIGMDTQVVLILAACDRDDPQENRKIRLLSREFDRFYVLLQLNQAYDSNTFNDVVYQIRSLIAAASADDYHDLLDRVLLLLINRKWDAEIESPHNYSFFRQVGYESFGSRFLRYFLARVETYIAAGINRKLRNSLYNLVRNNGKKNGYHIEHILGRNDENLALFNEDDEIFAQERNRLGGLLLLRGRDNQSSGNEPYAKKRKTYADTLYWNESLRSEFYKSKLDHTDFIERENLDLMEPIDQFDPQALDDRTRLLFEITKRIWA